MTPCSLCLRSATPDDSARLAKLNRELIRDEGHRNPMDETQLATRMRGWLKGEYEASLFIYAGEVIGYALYREDSDALYLRQFLINREWRRQGLGRQAFELLATDLRQRKPMMRLDVLSHNDLGIAFWRALGFQDYCVTMELTL